MYNILVCPICGNKLTNEGKSFFCNGERRHCFDIASSGYVNLCPSRHAGGDPKEAVRSRTDFLEKGYYKPISDSLCGIISEILPCETIVDAGCGEGYYTNNISQSTKGYVCGFDLSKSAVDAAAKSARRKNISNVGFFVSGIFDLPVADKSTDVITNIFAPCAETEFLRILKPNGVLIVVSSGKDHLMGLKRAIYDEVYPNEKRSDMPRTMTEMKKLRLTYEIDLDDEKDIRNLFAMTPYSYRTNERDHRKLLALSSIRTEVDIEIAVYKKGVDL